MKASCITPQCDCISQNLSLQQSLYPNKFLPNYQNTSTPSTPSVILHKSTYTSILVIKAIQSLYYSERLSVSLFTSTNFIEPLVGPLYLFLGSLHSIRSGIPKDHYLKSEASFSRNIQSTRDPIQPKIELHLYFVSF